MTKRIVCECGEGGREGGKERGRKGGEGGREGRRERGREGGKNTKQIHDMMYSP